MSMPPIVGALYEHPLFVLPTIKGARTIKPRPAASISSARRGIHFTTLGLSECQIVEPAVELADHTVGPQTTIAISRRRLGTEPQGATPSVAILFLAR